MDRVNMVPGFILKLWKMINDPQCDDLITWTDNGQSFIIMDTAKFSQELSKYFKHNNLSSFIRQLNMYGFRKVATIDNSGLHPPNEDLHFYHPDFVKGRPEKLEAIKRKLPQKISETVDLRNVIKGINDIEHKQKDVSQAMSDLKRENEMLWAEIHDLRQKHQQQAQYISRLMKLVFEAMEQNGIKTNMLSKQQSPLMIEGGDGLMYPQEIPQNMQDMQEMQEMQEIPQNMQEITEYSDSSPTFELAEPNQFGNTSMGSEQMSEQVPEQISEQVPDPKQNQAVSDPNHLMQAVSNNEERIEDLIMGISDDMGLNNDIGTSDDNFVFFN